MEKNPLRSHDRYLSDMDRECKEQFAQAIDKRTDRMYQAIRYLEMVVELTPSHAADLTVRESGEFHVDQTVVTAWTKTLANQMRYLDHLEDEDRQKGDSEGNNYINFEKR